MPDAANFHRVLSVRGRTGAVLGLVPCRGEAAADIASSLQSCLPEEALQQVEHVAVDNPSAKLVSELQEVLPSLGGVSLDPTHAAMHYEEAFGRRRAFLLVRSFMAKFTGHDPAILQNIWGPLSNGYTFPRLTAAEVGFLERVLTSALPKAAARRVFTQCSGLHVWRKHIEFIEALAALAAMHNVGMQKKI